MSFIWPIMLLSLLLLPLLVWLYLRQQRWRQRLAASYGNFGLGQTAAGGQPGWRRHLPPALFLTGLALLLMALARPQATVSLPRQEGTVILAFDVSGSMAAADLQPTRLEAAKIAAMAFVQRQPASIQIGIVAFSDGGFTVQTPTNNQDAILTTLQRLTPQRGTSLGQGILASLNAIAAETEPTPELETSLTPASTPTVATATPLPEGTYTPAVIILLTDGENLEAPDPLETAQLAAERGVRIYPVGIGSTAGTTLKINGFTVHTRLDETMLQQIAQLSDGVYYNAENEEELLTIYDNLNPQLVIKPEKMEITSLFAGASMVIMVIGGTFSLLWFNRVP